MDHTFIERLRPCRVCDGLTDQQVERVAAACTWRELQPEETLAYPGDSVYALYTVTRGRVRIYRTRDTDSEGFLGYVNHGETVGQTSLFSDQFDESRIIADMPSQIAVIGRKRALRLIFDIDRFRDNLMVAFGLRLDRILRGQKLRRFPRVVGVASGSPASGRLLPLLASELGRRGETVAVLTDRLSEMPGEAHAVSWRPDRSPHADLSIHFRELFGTAERILVDIAFPQSADSIRQLAQHCDELLWCCDNDPPDEANESLLADLVRKHVPLKSRIVCVQILSADLAVGRLKPCCEDLVQRDFMLPLADVAKALDPRYQQGMDRIVRHLRGIKIGLALGGGGARGLSHLGVLRALDRANVSFDLMSGTSAGAMIGLGYAAGMSPDFLIETFASKLQPPPLMENIPGGRRFYLFTKFYEREWEMMLRQHYRHWTFQQLPIPFSVVATDLVAGEEVVQETGDIVQAILESINVPVMANPILKDGKVLVDGGVLNNLPAELLTDRGADYVLGVDVSKEIPDHFAGNYRHMRTEQMKLPGKLETAYRVMEVSRRGITRLQMSFADLVIEPDTSAFDFADFSAAAAIAETGEAATEKALPELQRDYDELMNG
jgi:NTE family protein